MPGPYDELEKEAENSERRSKDEFKLKNFVAAITLLEEALEIYSKLGFQGKIGMINQRIAQLKNLVKYEKQDTVVRTKGEVEFQQRVDKVIEEKEKLIDKKLSEQKALPPEMKRKLEQIGLLVEKAEKEEKLGKISRVLGRYEYILDIYKSIPKDVMNFSNEINEIEKKLSTLRSKQ
jgi:tetratricopeptide (TPR) repeat protein